MKILHLIYDDIKNPWLAGGGARAVHQINKRFSKKHIVKVVTGNYPCAVDGNVDGVYYKRIGMAGNYFLSRLTYVFSIPLLIFKETFDIIVDDVSPFSPSFSFLYTRKPVIASMRIDFSLIDVLKRHKVLGMCFYICLRLSFLTYKYYFANAPKMKELILKRAIRKITVEYLPRGIDLAEYKICKKEKNYLLYLGRIDVYEKGLDVLLKAFTYLKRKNIKLVIAGSGTKEKVIELKNLIKDYKLSNKVKLVGKVEGEKKIKLLSECLFVCMPSRYESWGAVAIESYASGKTIVGTTILCDSVKYGKTGVLVNLGNPHEFYLAMKKLVDSPSLRKHLAKNGFQFAKKLNWDHVIIQYEKFYRKILKCHKKI